MSEIKTFGEIENILKKVGYKVTHAVYDDDFQTIDIKAKSVVKPVQFPNMDNYNQED